MCEVYLAQRGFLHEIVFPMKTLVTHYFVMPGDGVEKVWYVHECA